VTTREIKLHVVTKQDPPADAVKLPVGHVLRLDNADDQFVVEEYARTHKLPPGVALVYTYDTDPIR
jgi:hypothetical protein